MAFPASYWLTLPKPLGLSAPPPSRLRDQHVQSVGLECPTGRTNLPSLTWPTVSYLHVHNESRKEQSKLNSVFVYPRVGFPRWLSGKQPTCNAEDTGDSDLIPVMGRAPEGGHGYPITVFLLGESHGQRRLVGYSPWCHKESDMTEVTEHAHTHTQISILGSRDENLV